MRVKEKSKYREEITALIRTFGIDGIFAYFIGYICGYFYRLRGRERGIRGFAGEHKAVIKCSGLLFLTLTVILSTFFTLHAFHVLPQLRREKAAEASIARAAEKPGTEWRNEEKTVIEIRLDSEDWCTKNVIYVSAEDSLAAEYRYVCPQLGIDTGWTDESSMDVSSNGTWTIMVRDAAGNVAEREIKIDNIDTQAPVIRSITEKHKEEQ